jgi:hypothetical protein
VRGAAALIGEAGAVVPTTDRARFTLGRPVDEAIRTAAAVHRSAALDWALLVASV